MQTFDADEDLQSVLVHLVQVIGEAAAGLSDEFTSQHSEIPWRQIVAVRNRVAHGYFEVDPDILWDVAKVDVPHLADQVRVIRSKLTDEPDGAVPMGGYLRLRAIERHASPPARLSTGALTTGSVSADYELALIDQPAARRAGLPVSDRQWLSETVARGPFVAETVLCSRPGRAGWGCP